MRAGFQAIKKEHVDQACEELVSEGVGRGGSSYTIAKDGRELPAKRVLQVAYRIATGTPIHSSKFSGGEFTARILRRLGIEVHVRVSPDGVRTAKTQELSGEESESKP